MPISPYDGYTARSNWIRANQPVVVTNVSALRALDKTKISYAVTKGYYTAGDGGAGEYWYDSSDTTSVDNGGSVIVATDGGRWKLIFSSVIHVCQFGAKGDWNGTSGTDDAAAINAAATFAISNGLWLDFRGSKKYKVASRLVFTGLSGLFCDPGSYIIADTSGTYTNGWVCEFGNPAVTAFNGRSDALQIVGCLTLVATSRNTVLNGIYLKGSWLNIGHLRVGGFNGCGVYQDSVWDSTTQRISVELCGNTSTYSINLSSNGDTHNTSHIGSIQCEQAYHKGIYINDIRDVIDNIHAERLAVLTTSDGTPVCGYLNHSITCSNCQINQGTFNCLTSGTAPDGSTLAATTINVLLNLADSSISNCSFTGTCYRTFGGGSTYINVSAVNMYESGPAGQAHYSGGSFSGVFSPYSSVSASNMIIGTFNPSFNAANISIDGSSSISTISFSSSIIGNITIKDSTIGTIAETKAPAPGYSPFTVVNCNITTLTGAYNDQIRVTGGYINSVSLASQAVVYFENGSCGTFSYTGTPAYITRGWIGPSSTTWSTPSIAFASGCLSERVGYSSSGKLYQNTDGGTTWSKIA